VTIYTTDMGGPASAPPSRLSRAEIDLLTSHVDVRVFRAQRPWRFAYAPGLGRALRIQAPQFDVLRVHGVYLYPNYVAAREARRAHVPYVVTPHGALDPWLRRHGRLRKDLTTVAWQARMLRRAAAIHVMTDDERRLTQDVAPSRVPRRVIGNGLDVAAFSALPARGPFRESVGIPAHVPLILCFGRLSHTKGLDVLIEALGRLRRQDAFLAIVGPDDEGLTPRLVALARSAGVAGRVIFAGPRFGRERLQVLADADLWALASHTENFGIAVVEALAAGLPVVMSDQVNISTEAQASRGAVVVPVDASAFAAACDGVLDMRMEERAKLCQSGRAFATRYAWPSIAAELGHMFEAVARGGDAIGLE
jgi:glycosyltransferase involved in cell wall biosynthesis